jgi:hypothetical protein
LPPSAPQTAKYVVLPAKISLNPHSSLDKLIVCIY